MRKRFSSNLFIISMILFACGFPGDRGLTDKKLTSKYVIRTFLSFELADNFFKLWESFAIENS